MDKSMQENLNVLKEEYEKGNLEKAGKLCSELLDFCREPAERILLLEYQSNIFRDGDKISQAIDSREKQLAVIKEEFGEEHSHTAAALHNLALLYARRGLLPKAREYSGQSVAILKKILPPNDSRIADSLVNLSMQLYAMAKFGEAESLLKEALAVYIESQGEESFGVSTCYNNLGRICEHLEETEKAVYFHAKAVEIRKKILGRHAETAFCLGNYATALAGNNQLKEAVDAYNEAIAIYTELGLEDSKEAQICIANKQVCVATTGHCP